MKKLLALAIAACLALACVPAFAFTGFPSDPGMPDVASVSEAIFPVDVRRVENEPEVVEDEWGDEINVWHYMDNTEAIAAGDVVTVSCEMNVPADLDFSEEMLNAIEVIFTFTGLDNITIADASGCDTNYECDYEHGYCYPLPGYGNAKTEGDSLIVDAHPGKNIKVYVTGAASAESIGVSVVTTIGQYKLPTHFSCGKLEKTGSTYFVHYKDTFMVQDRGMKFIANGGAFADYYVYLNNHDYHRYITFRGDASYVEVVNGEDTENVVTAESDSVKYDALELAYSTYMGFFGFADDGNADALTDGVFLYGSDPSRCNEAFKLGAEEDEPTPTEPVVDPTEPAPTEPADPTPPKTGAVSLAVIGVAALAGGVGVVALRKRED